MRPLLTLGGLLGLLAALPGCGGPADTRPQLAFVSNNSHTFWNYAQKGAEQAGKDLDVRVVVRKPSRGSAEEQRQIIEDLITRGTKGLAVSPNDADNTVDFYKENVNTRVPLVMADNDLPDPAARRCYVGTNNYKAGRSLGEQVKKAVPGGGKIAIFVGSMDSRNAQERRQGVLDYLADPKTAQTELGAITPPGATDHRVGEYVLISTRTDAGKPEECQTRARELLIKSPDVACLIGLWEYNPPALLRAVRAADLAKRPAIVGFDENYDTMEGIIAGEIAASVVQDPYQFGYRSMKILAGLIKGDDSVLKAPDVDAKGRIFIPYQVIDKSNVNDFYAKLKKLNGN